ncbi:MAG: sialate O-acetylesterase [Bacteroidales bacterium]
MKISKVSQVMQALITERIEFSKQFATRGTVLAFCAIVVGVASVRADIKLPAVIGSNMIIQRDVPMKLWGWADANEQVTVTIEGENVGSAVADVKGNWSVMLPARAAGAVPDMVISGKNSIELKNLLAGDVWICSGQSNMAMTLRVTPRIRFGGVANADAEVAAAKYPNIRLFTVTEAQRGLKPVSNCVGEWKVCSPEAIEDFSATAYFFGRELHQKTNVPVGLVVSAVGGSSAELWTPRTVLDDPSAAAAKQGYNDEYPGLVSMYDQQYAEWQKVSEDAKAKGATVPREPRKPQTPQYFYAQWGAFYNSLIYPLTPMRIKGAIWYQGEANAGRAGAYVPLLTNMIGSWRQAWNQGNFPFLIVQLANCRIPSIPVDGTWAELREAQTTVATTVPGCGMATAYDTGGPNGSLHPINKQTIGQRLALVALKQVYRQSIEADGPSVDKVNFKKDCAVVKYKNFGGGLVAKDGVVKGFTIAGNDGRFVAAEATIEGNSVVVKSAEVSSPKAVRFGWADNPAITLYSKEGLPALPFRTDTPSPSSPSK